MHQRPVGGVKRGVNKRPKQVKVMLKLILLGCSLGAGYTSGIIHDQDQDFVHSFPCVDFEFVKELKIYGVCHGGS